MRRIEKKTDQILQGKQVNNSRNGRNATKTRFFLVLAFSFTILLPLSLCAQIEEGASLIGGTGSLKIGAYDFFGEVGGDATSISLSPKFISFVTDQFGIGGSLHFEYVSFYGESVTSLGVSPIVRYYMNTTGNLKPFAQAYVGYSRVFFYGEGIGRAILGLGVGVDYFLNKNIAIEVVAGYDRIQVFAYEEGFGSFGISVGVAAFIFN